MRGPYGKSQQFKLQLETIWQRLYRVCYAWNHDAQLCADLVQESIESALRNSHKIPDSASLEKWLFKVLINKWRDHCRTHKNHIELEETTVHQEETPESEHEMKETIQRVQKAMGRLNSEQREVLSLIALEGLSYTDVAQILDVPVGTVMSRLCRARKLLRNYLRDPDIGQGRSTSGIRRIK